MGIDKIESLANFYSHAPAGHDALLPLELASPDYFYSHAPAGHDRGRPYTSRQNFHISTPMPLRGMTDYHAAILIRANISTPMPLRGMTVNVIRTHAMV